MSSLSEVIKQRLIGALVLISGAIIFIPMVFDGRQELPSDIPSQMPKTPNMIYLKNFKSSPQQLMEDDLSSQWQSTWNNPLQEQKIAPAASTDQSFVSENNAPENNAPENNASENNASENKAIKTIAPVSQGIELKSRPNLAKNGQVKAWSVQVGSFEQLERADQLKQSLQKKGFKAYTQTVETDTLSTIRVLVGPRLQWEKIVALKDKIKKQMNIDGVIMRYQP